MATGIVPDPPNLVASCPVWTRRRFFQAMLAAGLGAFIPAIGGCSSTPSVGAIREALQALRRQRIAPPPVEGHREFRGVVHAPPPLSHARTGTVQAVPQGRRAAQPRCLLSTGL